MTPSWIKEAQDIYADGGDWDDFEPLFEKVTRLLRRAMLSTEDPTLYDDISKELNDESNS